MPYFWGIDYLGKGVCVCVSQRDVMARKSRSCCSLFSGTLTKTESKDKSTADQEQPDNVFDNRWFSKAGQRTAHESVRCIGLRSLSKCRGQVPTGTRLSVVMGFMLVLVPR